MRRRLTVAMASAALWAMPPLAAQTAPAQASADEAPLNSTIVVTGKQAQAPTGNEVLNEARGISRLGPYDAYVVALARFWEPVCPGVTGLRADYAEAMVERMRGNVVRLKVPLAKPGCSPNLVVAFEEDGRLLLSGLERQRPGIFSLVSQSEQAEMLADKAPVRVWNNIAERWTGAGPLPEKGVKASVWGQLDRNAMPYGYDILGALIVFDRSAAEGLTLTQLADYATMRGLSHTRPPSGAQPMATILSLFDQGGAGPDELTDFDIGYLRSLYWWRPNASAANKLVDVRRWVQKDAKDTVKR